MCWDFHASEEKNLLSKKKLQKISKTKFSKKVFLNAWTFGRGSILHYQLGTGTFIRQDYYVPGLLGARAKKSNFNKKNYKKIFFK